MNQAKNKKPEKGEESNQNKEKNWVEKTEEFIDDKAEKIHKSEAYQKADKAVENVTKNIFRKAGKLWGKSEHYFKKKSNKKDGE